MALRMLALSLAVLSLLASTFGQVVKPTIVFPKSCPTISVTSQYPAALCPTRPPLCITPACIRLTSISVPCNCPTTVPTHTSYLPCTARCTGGCGTYWSTILPSTKCISTKPYTTTKSTKTTITKPYTTTTPIIRTTPWTTVTKSPPTVTSCDTITVTTGKDCPPTPTACSYIPDCIILSSATARCGCNGVVEKTECRTTCIQGCLTQFQTLYQPCATAVPT